MVLKFNFLYNSNNSNLLFFLENIVNQSALEYKLLKKEAIELYVQGNEKELISFSNELSSSLPMSIFLKNSTAEVVPQIPTEENTTFKLEELNLPFCSSCLKKVEDSTKLDNFYNPFVSCTICGTTCDVKELKLLKNNISIEIKDNKELFEKVASLINEDKSIKIKTLSGEFIFKKFNPSLENNAILCTNLENISKVFVASKAEVVALASIEKPSIDLRINEVFKLSNNVKQEILNVRFVNDLILYLISKELEKYNIDFLSYDKTSLYDYELTFEGIVKPLDILKVKILENDTVILESNSYDKTLDTIYSKFKEESKGHFMVLLHEYDFYEKAILNFYSSSKNDDNIILYSKEIDGFLDIVKYELPQSINEIFETLKSDEVATRLVDNYKNKFPNEYEIALSCDISSLKENSIYSYWKIVSVILGFTSKIEQNNILLEKAMACVLEKGPRIDYKLKESDKIFNRNFLLYKLIQSGMSFKLAGVDDNTLALGYIESFAHYIATLVDDINNEVTLDGISLTGDIFTNTLISKLVHKSITKNFKIYYNKDFVIQK
ncbi:hypothetical protein CRU99_05795 [Malaciobacter mytili]|uniref:hypothetical protein n=1 Tax=Malaciobacter mytili TaxID=603050 RepID=UPI00100A9628|nr:hypothetical protein [Malaciobacter mytili]RXI44146.1 hypothetical protein CRU99_05795 [Malaciobacter mytili]